MAAMSSEIRKRRRLEPEVEGFEPAKVESVAEAEAEAEELKPKRSQGVGWGGAFVFLMIARYYSASHNNIHDCDEVFNYWEPLHYLLYKSGFQTWEYRCGFAPTVY